MKRSILLFTLFFIFIIFSFGQPSYHFFGEAENDNGISQIAETSDGNLLILGTKTLNSIPKIWLQKITQDGQLIWEKNLNSVDFNTHYGIQLKIEDDGSILILGEFNYGYGTEFIKTNENGEIIWQKHFSEELYDFQKKGDNYFLVGRHQESSGPIYGFLLKSDLFGNQVSSKTYTTPQRKDEAMRIFSIKDSDKFLIFGRSAFSSRGEDYIISAEMDEFLNLGTLNKIESNKSPFLFGFLEGFTINQFPSCQTQNDDFWISFSNPDTLGQIILIKFDSTGTEKVRKIIPIGDLSIRPYSINPLKDGSLLITGYEEEAMTAKRAFAMKTSDEGNKVWTKYYEPRTKNVLTSSLETSCGRIFLAGIADESIANPYYDGFLIEKSSFHNVFIDTTVCIENLITIRGQVFDQTGTYQLRFPDINNSDPLCDTTINLNLTIADIHAPKIECFHDTFVNGLAIEWETVPLTEGYKIFINGDSVTTQTFTSYLHVLNSPDETIQFEVVPFNSTGCRFYAASAECTATSDTRVIYDSENQILVVPNPSTGHFQLQTNLKIEQIEVFDSFGRLLLKTKESAIDLSDQASGIYFFKVRTSEGFVLKKGVKI